MWLDASRPRQFLTRLGWVSGAVAGLALISVVVIATIAGPASRSDIGVGIALATLGLVPPFLVVLWCVYVYVVALRITLHLAPPVPLRERNVLWFGVTWLARVTWATALLIISGIVGGAIAYQIGSINETYVASAPSITPSPTAYVPAPLSNAAITANIQMVDLVYSWMVGAFLLFTFLVLYVLPGWLTYRLLLARTEGRRAALEESFRRQPSSERKAAWLPHLAHWGYPVAFGLFAALLVGTTVLFTIAWCLDLAHNALDSYITSLRG
ncbi:hypothetical protein [Leifsonia sp. Leaf336]|uniref:hypothetical protein n=1 Tax=Leifsonia sp. Leaf336 TaxID=1736341 RepID=UPI0012FCE298|nr:hypothetical protein [Leifsonia sp. Leaf336]